MPDIREPRVHARFLAYRERHLYFGRGVNRIALTAEAFATLDAEHGALSTIPVTRRTEAENARLDELRVALHLD